jgi:GT2 family glycosyltransferase
MTAHSSHATGSDSVTVSVVVVTFDSAAEIADCLASVTAARGDIPLELVVVDNASSDQSATIASQAQPDILMINPRNVGFARAVNQAIRRSSGQYVLLLNPDATLGDRALARLVGFLESHPSSAAVGPQVRSANGEIVRSCRTFPSLLTVACQVTGLAHRFPASRIFGAVTLSFWDYASERRVDYATGACLLLRRAALDEVGLLDESYFMYVEEMDLCWRFWQAGWTVDFTPTARALHLGGRSVSQVRQEHGYEPLLLREYYAGQIRFQRKYRHPGDLLAWRLLISGSNLVGAAIASSRVLLRLLTRNSATRRQAMTRLRRSLLVTRLAWGPGAGGNYALTEEDKPV